jgi:RNA polymerase sigma-70 factor (ECF subfamily)
MRALAAPISSPSQRVYRRERAVRLGDAMERLPAASREVLLLRHVQDLSFPQIARRMDRTLDGVKNLWIRELTRLRREMVCFDELD